MMISELIRSLSSKEQKFKKSNETMSCLQEWWKSFHSICLNKEERSREHDKLVRRWPWSHPFLEFKLNLGVRVLLTCHLMLLVSVLLRGSTARSHSIQREKLVSMKNSMEVDIWTEVQTGRNAKERNPWGKCWSRKSLQLVGLLC